MEVGGLNYYGGTEVGNGGNGDKQEKTISVTPGQTYTIVVGRGGRGSATSVRGNDRNITSARKGESSSFQNYVANGGGPGGHEGYYGGFDTGSNAGNGQGGRTQLQRRTRKTDGGTPEGAPGNPGYPAENPRRPAASHLTRTERGRRQISSAAGADQPQHQGTAQKDAPGNHSP